MHEKILYSIIFVVIGLTAFSSAIDDKNRHTGFVLSVGIVIFMTAVTILNKPEKVEKIKNMINNKWYLINLIAVILFSIYSVGHFGYNSKIGIATRHGIYAAIIAFCAAIDITLAPFWITHILAYFGHGWV